MHGSVVTHAEHFKRDHVLLLGDENIFHLLYWVWYPIEDEGLVLHGRVEIRSKGRVTKWVYVGKRMLMTPQLGQLLVSYCTPH